MPTAHRASPRSGSQSSAHIAEGACSVATLLPQSIAFDHLLADLSVRFVNLAPDKVDEAITESLRRICELLGVERTQLIRFASGKSRSRVTHSGATQGVAEGSPGSLATLFPWAIAQLRGGHTIVFGRLDDLPAAAAVDRATYQRFNVKAGLVVPLEVDGVIEGAIAVDCEQTERRWPAELVERMQLMVTIFGSALADKRAREQLDAAMRFERTVADVFGALLAAPRQQQDRVLEQGLQAIGLAFGADRVTLWQRVGDTAEFSKSHRWAAQPDVPKLPLPGIRLGWINAQLVTSKVVRFACHADLCTEAASDLPGLRALGIGAAVIVPLELAGRVAGALSVATAREPTEWPDVLLPRAQLLGQAFASFIARQQAEQRELQAQAQAAHAARVATLGVFAASLVHELTQPLAASLANAETAHNLLAPPAPDLGAARETVADIVTDSRRAGELIQKLRRFLRHGEAERSEIDVSAWVGDVVGFVANEAAAKSITLTLDLPKHLPPFHGDRVQMQQVLLNLLLNAFDAVASRSSGSRRVSVQAHADASALRIEVADNGAGMDAATLARVFQPFFSTRPDGMGLGLSICQTIVAGHGGTISATSDPGTGTRFLIELPLRQALVVSPAVPAAAPAPGDDCVFVVDDDDAMRRALQRQLLAEGYRVEGFANAHAFLDGAQRAEVACIVSDVRMPGLSGLDLQATMARRGTDWPMVFISGHADVPTSVQAMKAGAIAFLPKPFAKAELLAAVADALALSRQRAAARHQQAELLQHWRSLTPREAEVFDLVVQGLLNKQVADRLGIAERTVKIHRGRVVEKMGAASVAELVRMAERIALHAGPAPIRPSVGEAVEVHGAASRRGHVDRCID